MRGARVLELKRAARVPDDVQGSALPADPKKQWANDKNIKSK